MPRLFPTPLCLTDSERSDLEQIVRKHKMAQQIVLRAQIILLADDGLNHRQIARELKISRDMARHWRLRWLTLAEREVPISERLQDAPRCGSPATFTPEQLTHLFAIACENPADSGHPISHWTAKALADELIRRGIVKTISERHVRRLLAEADLAPNPLLADTFY